MPSNNATSNLVVKIHGGLGNQFFQYALGRSLALRHGQPVVFDLSWYTRTTDQIKRKYELDNFQTVIKTADQTEVRALEKFKRAAGPVGFLKTILTANPKKYVQDFSYRYNPAILKTQPPAYLDGYWQSEKYFADIADAIRRELSLKEPPSGQNAEMLKRIQSTPSISLHVRRGDYVASKATNAFHGTTGLDYYRAAIEKVKSAAPNGTIYVFSDDQAWVKENLKFDLPTVFIDFNSGDRAHEDMRLMSACAHNVVANSTFSWWGAWLNPNPNKMVVAPKRWFADPRMDATDLIPSSWTQV